VDPAVVPPRVAYPIGRRTKRDRSSPAHTGTGAPRCCARAGSPRRPRAFVRSRRPIVDRLYDVSLAEVGLGRAQEAAHQPDHFAPREVIPGLIGAEQAPMRMSSSNMYPICTLSTRSDDRRSRGFSAQGRTSVSQRGDGTVNQHQGPLQTRQRALALQRERP